MRLVGMASPLDELFDRALQAQETGNFPLAAGLYAEVLEKSPANARAANNLGNVMLAMGHPAEARACFAQALATDSGMIEALYNLARLDQLSGRLKEAAEGYAAVLRSVRLEQAAYNRAIVLRDMGCIDEAVEAYTDLVSWAPDHANGWNNLGKARREQGEIALAVAAFERAVRCAPDDAEIASNRLFCLLHDMATTNEALLAAQRAYAERFEAPYRPLCTKAQNQRDPDRLLRVGFVSADLRNHPVGRFLLPLLEHLDHGRITAIAFNNAPIEDEVSTRLKECFTEWYSICTLDDNAAATLIGSKSVDVLIDLSGHTAGNRLGVFARKPASVQSTWMGYLGSTGMYSMDWRITDNTCDPPELEAWHTERLTRLPNSQWCYRPPADVSPKDRGGATEICLGSFTGVTKLSDFVLGLWGRVLIELPAACLLLAGIPKGRARQRITERLAVSGIEEGRLSFLDRLPIENYLAQMGTVDIMLDSFPYVGATSTCDALWMGVPVVSLKGSRSCSRSGASLLPQVGLSDWVAENADDYVRIVCRWARDPEQLHTLKHSLRGRMASSPLMDEVGFSRDWSAMIRTIWRDWCNGDE